MLEKVIVEFVFQSTHVIAMDTIKNTIINTINPKKLLNSKWTAVVAINKEKHFVVTEVIFNEEGVVIHCVIEAVLSRRAEPIAWQSLRNSSDWQQGWK